MGVVFLIAKIFEFIHRMILGSEIPVVIITKDLINFSLWSVGILIISCLYVRIALKKNRKINWSIDYIGGTSVVFFIIWSFDFFNALRYFRDNINVILVSFVAWICTTINLLQYIFYKYKIKYKK